MVTIYYLRHSVQKHDPLQDRWLQPPRCFAKTLTCSCTGEHRDEQVRFSRKKVKTKQKISCFLVLFNCFWGSCTKTLLTWSLSNCEVLAVGGWGGGLVRPWQLPVFLFFGASQATIHLGGRRRSALDQRRTHSAFWVGWRLQVSERSFFFF